ncbi:Ribosome biogenesis protein [Trichinella spiralis]|uniref:Ribosome biogenesis protein n=1 Tax=Trichinella spiralis TaxID=6334 RepID=A0ABR3KUZ1_TRISP
MAKQIRQQYSFLNKYPGLMLSPPTGFAWPLLLIVLTTEFSSSLTFATTPFHSNRTSRLFQAPFQKATKFRDRVKADDGDVQFSLASD